MSLLDSKPTAEAYLIRALGKGLLFAGLAFGITTQGISYYVGSPSPAEDIRQISSGEWVTYSADRYAEAKAAGATVVLYFGAPWCKYCVQNKKYTHSEAFLQAAKESNVVLLYVNLEEFAGPEQRLAKEYNVRGMPTYVVERPNRPATRWVGKIKDWKKTLEALGLEWVTSKNATGS